MIGFRCIGIGLFAALAWTLSGCAGNAPSEHAGAGPDAVGESAPTVAGAPAAEPSKSGRRFEEPGELDKLLDAKPLTLAAVKPASQASPTGTAPSKTPAPEKASAVKGNFRLQIGAESDIDAAQAKKAAYEKQLGGTVDMVFDQPYYKLRWGYFDTKQDAEDKLLELSDQRIQGFVIKQ